MEIPDYGSSDTAHSRVIRFERRLRRRECEQCHELEAVMGGVNLEVVDGCPCEDDVSLKATPAPRPGAALVNTVGQMVRRILHRLGPDGRIRRLRVCGHAAPGGQGLGQSRCDLSPTHTMAIYDNSTLRYGSELGQPPGPVRARWLGRTAWL